MAAALPSLARWSASLLLVQSLAHAQSPVDCTPPANAKQLETRLDQAKKDRIAGKRDAAASTVDSILAVNPNYFRALYTKGLLLADEHNFTAAETPLQKAIEVQQKCASTPQFKSDYTVYNTLGWVQLVNGKPGKAEQSFNTALAHADQLSPASVARTKSNLGYLYFSNGEFSKAQPLLQQAAAAGNANAANTLNTLNQAQQIYKESAARQAAK